MILSDRDIKKALKSGKIIIRPAIEESTQLGSCMVDLKLGTTFRVFKHSSTPYLDPKDSKTMENVTSSIKVAQGKAFVLHPGEFTLAQTEEYVEMPDDLTASLEGRSSIGRLGVIIHSTAANIECGFRGTITLELANMGRIPVLLYPGMRICALSFHQLSTPADIPYHKKKGAKYIGQKQPEPSRIGEE